MKSVEKSMYVECQNQNFAPGGGGSPPPDPHPALAFSSQLTQTSIFSAHWEVLHLISETLG